jgi:hypothetical protein
MYAAPPRINIGGRSNVTGKVGTWLQRRGQEKQQRAVEERQARENQRITNERMQQERIAHERQETAAQVQRQETKRRLMYEKQAFEQQQAQKARATMVTSGMPNQVRTNVPPRQTTPTGMAAQSTTRRFRGIQTTTSPPLATRQNPPALGVRRTSELPDHAALAAARAAAIEKKE